MMADFATPIWDVGSDCSSSWSLNLKFKRGFGNFEDFLTVFLCYACRFIVLP